jgi:hypothetical protein
LAGRGAKHQTASSSGSSKSAIEKGASAINPNDVDYGGLLAEWRLAAVQETLENAYYWIILILGLAVSFLFFLLMIKEKEKQRRLAISADVVAQLFNAWQYANWTARTTIEKHNDWVTRLNDEYEATLRGTPEPGAPSVASLPPSPTKPPASPEKTVARDPFPAPRVPEIPIEAPNDKPPIARRTSVPSLDASEFAEGLGNPPGFFGGRPTTPLSKKQPEERPEMNVEAALAAANNAAARAIDVVGDSDNEEQRESSADEVKRLRAQVGALQSKVSAQQQQLNRDRERRAREEGKLNVVQGVPQ